MYWTNIFILKNYTIRCIKLIILLIYLNLFQNIKYPTTIAFIKDSIIIIAT